MKFSRMASLVCLLCLFPLSVPVQAADSLKISSTIGPVDAGILPLLADTFSKKTGIAISMEKAGTGKTLKKAESGTFDLVMVHARKLEDAFVAAGFGVDRRDVMYNDFVILGPAGDPAGIKGMKSAAEAFATIAKAGVPFVSRGDKSGTMSRKWTSGRLPASSPLVPGMRSMPTAPRATRPRRSIRTRSRPTP